MTNNLALQGIETLRERESITPFDTGLNMYGGGQFAEGNTPEARQALEVLKSIDPNQPGNFHMQGGTALDYKANGGYMSSFPNQNLNTESLSASDNIDDRSYSSTPSIFFFASLRAPSPSGAFLTIYLSSVPPTIIGDVDT